MSKKTSRANYSTTSFRFEKYLWSPLCIMSLLTTIQRIQTRLAIRYFVDPSSSLTEGDVSLLATRHAEKTNSQLDIPLLIQAQANSTLVAFVSYGSVLVHFSQVIQASQSLRCR